VQPCDAMQSASWLVIVVAASACSSSDNSDPFGPASFTINGSGAAVVALMGPFDSPPRWSVGFYGSYANSCDCMIDSATAEILLGAQANASSTPKPLAPGAYPVTASGPNTVTIDIPNIEMTLTSGSVQITLSTQSQIEGTVSADGTGSGSEAVHVEGAFRAGSCGE